MAHLDPEAIRGILLALNDIATGGRIDQSAEDLRVQAAGFSGSARHVAMDMSAAAPKGLLNASLGVMAEGLSVTSLPANISAWLPRRVVLRPSLSGLSVADLTRIAMLATEPNIDQQALQAALAALLAHGGVTVGIDALSLDVGPAEFEGNGQLLIRAPDDVQGNAQITATGMDALLPEMHKNPDLAPILGGLAIAINLARREGNRLIWDIDFRDGRLTVNGVDPRRPRPNQQFRSQPGSTR